jgi:hypothetical protein
MSASTAPWMTNILGLGDAKGLMSEASSDKLHGNKFN